MRLDKKDLVSALRILSEGRELFVPGEIGGVTRFVLWDGTEPKLGGVNTVLPPKDILFPKTEKMYSYKSGADMEIDETSGAPERAVFGIRPCDVHSIECMDAVFIDEGRPDSYYSARRAKCLIAALACPGAGENCFCEAMGLDPNSAPGADLLFTDGGSFWCVAAQTDKGRAELEKWGGLLTDGPDVRGDTHCSLHPPFSPQFASSLPELFHDDALWDRVTAPCLKCGTCSFVCPTCYCFDIGSESVGAEGMAFRCWDSCMFSDYNQNAGGHNTRPTKKERLRNRYMHKLSYFGERHGMTLCAGCGRCVEKCPAHLDITEFITAAEEALHG